MLSPRTIWPLVEWHNRAVASKQFRFRPSFTEHPESWEWLEVLEFEGASLFEAG
jgi:hypothetical protein